MAKRKLSVVGHPLDLSGLGRALFEAAAFTMADAFNGKTTEKLFDAEEEIRILNEKADETYELLTEAQIKIEEYEEKAPPNMISVVRRMLLDFDRGFDDCTARGLEELRFAIRDIDGAGSLL